MWIAWIGRSIAGKCSVYRARLPQREPILLGEAACNARLMAGGDTDGVLAITATEVLWWRPDGVGRIPLATTVRLAAFLPPGRLRVYTGARILECIDFRCKQTGTLPLKGRHYRLLLSRTGDELLIHEFEPAARNVVVVDGRSGAPIRTMELPSDAAVVQTFLHEDGDVVVLTLEAGIAHLYRVDRSQIVYRGTLAPAQRGHLLLNAGEVQGVLLQSMTNSWSLLAVNTKTGAVQTVSDMYPRGKGLAERVDERLPPESGSYRALLGDGAGCIRSVTVDSRGEARVSHWRWCE